MALNKIALVVILLFGLFMLVTLPIVGIFFLFVTLIAVMVDMQNAKSKGI